MCITYNLLHVILYFLQCKLLLSNILIKINTDELSKYVHIAKTKKQKSLQNHMQGFETLSTFSYLIILHP